MKMMKDKLVFSAVASLAPAVLVAQMIVRPWSQTNEALEKRVAADCAGRPAALAHYAVPAMSDLQRLPDVYPEDGQAGAPVTIVAAKGEYEPGAFLVYPFEDMGKVTLEVGDLKNGTGVVFPKENLDLKVVKVWYQNGNGWYSYFGDCGNKLCPELLLNDEDLIRVDTEKKANYARITQPDGSVKEKWINPPRQMDRIDPGSDGSPRAFQPMRPGFADAKTLQPVRLKKGEFRSFFLTAHVTKDVPAGLYRGEIVLKGGLKTGDGRQVIGTVPVVIRVLDFELPQYPGTYADPDRELLVSSYAYYRIKNILEQNGGDVALARRQLVAMLRNLVTHGQSLYISDCGLDGEGDFTFKAMREAGMRQDLFHGGARLNRFTHMEAHKADLAEHAKLLAAAYDRRVGHHNFFLGFGDEPSAQWVADNRPVFEAYQNVGFRFFIAGSDNVFNKGGHFYDWNNISKDPVDDSSTRLWNQMEGSPALAWYSTHHVGPENPAFNRRQYGMGAYLAGYSALCNYAHHLGPYNDDSTTYRPMVFAYGTADGVIDTLQWEGFREGVDDMRYATVLVKLARAAAADGTRKGRVTGNIALMQLARFDRACGDLDTCRAEMIDQILKLKAYLGPKADVALAKGPAAPKAPANVKVEPAKETTVESLRREMRYAEASELLEREGKVVEAMKEILTFEGFGQKCAVDDEPRFERLARRMLAEGLGTAEERRWAGTWLYLHRAQGEETYLPQAIGKDTNGFVRVLGWQLGWVGGIGQVTGPLRYGDWDRTIRAEGLMRKAVKPGKPFTLGWKQAIQFGMAHAATGDFDGMRAALAAGLAHPKLKDEERATLQLASDVIGRKISVDELKVRAREVGAKNFDLLGCFANVAGDEELLRTFVACRPAVNEVCPKKSYTVRFSDRAVTGAHGWEALEPKPEAQPLDRKFGGGSLEFMTTDVSTGDRGAAAGAVKGARPATLQVVADDWGVHFRFEAFDPRMREFAAGTLDFGSFECYLAPGENQPYTCFLVRLTDPVRTSLFGTTYSTVGHRRIDGNDPNLFRRETVFTDESCIAYTGFSWDNFATLVPVDGAAWDFESVNWGPKSSAWNGTESIHGRSTWGKLVFALPESARLRILRRQIYHAIADFRVQRKSMSGVEGDFAHWKDAELGDPRFYYDRVKPLEDELEAAAQRATGDMSDETVRELAEKYLAKWREVRFIVQGLRTDWLARRRRDEVGQVPDGFRLPWKDLAICIDPPATKNIDRFCAFIRDRLGPDGFRTLVLRLRWRYQFESHPECRGKDPLSKEDAAKIVAACKAAGVRLVPKVNLFGHQGEGKGPVTQGILAAHPEWDESRGRETVRSNACRSICPSEPEARKVVLDVALEAAAVFGADTFHFGCDEVFEIGSCEKCRKIENKWGGKGNAGLFADWVNGLARGLKEKGIGSMIWGDRLVDMNLTGTDFWESSDNGTSGALALLDKDIVLCDWRYWVREGYPSVDVFQDAGFRMWACVWKDPAAAKDYLAYAARHDHGNVLGAMLTSWYGADGFLDALEGKPGCKEQSLGEAKVYNLLKAIK